MTEHAKISQTDSHSTDELPKHYSPADHESRIWERWVREGCFRADPDRVLDGSAKPYCVLMPPPNVTDRLHIGHALNGTLQDVLVRAKRMMGFETLWMPGTDHAGIATQTRVEKRLLETEGKARQDFTRDAFVARVQSFKDEYEATITEQFKRLGASADWDLQRFTMDETCARAVREAFFQLFKDGLVYRGKRLVNWDPVTQTALADDEVEDQDVEGHFYYLRYPLYHPWDHDEEPTPVTWSELGARGYVGAEAHPEDEPAWVTVATTRPETYLGDSAVAVNPGDPRAAALRELCVELPLIGRVIPIVEDDYVVMADPESSDAKAQYATGFLKVTPAHDTNDWEIGLRHKLKVINVMAPDATISDKHGWDDPEELKGGHVFVGLSREDARQKVIEEFQARGLMEDIKPYTHTVGHSYRSHAAIEPYLSDQWYVKVTDDRMRGEALRAMADDQYVYNPENPAPRREGDGDATSDGQLRFYPARYARTFQLWHENLRDWCISRQLWWGHRIPVWHPSRIRTVEEIESPESTAKIDLLLAWQREGRIALQYRGEFVDLERLDKEDSSLDATFICVRDPMGEDADIVTMLQSADYQQDPDVLDTWFSSALWPISTMGWPDEESDLLKAFNPSNALCTAREIITLWVSRMVMFNRYFRDGDLPFNDVFIHALVMDGQGRKMSKSLGNGVDPLDIIATHGADAMRYTLCKMTTQTQDLRLPVERDEKTGHNTSNKFDEGRNFCNKLWNAGRLTVMLCERREGDDTPGNATAAGEIDPASLSLVDRWMLSRLARTVAQINTSLDQFQYSPYAQSLYDLLWRDFCDWYLEAIKPTVGADANQRVVLATTFDAILRLLHPVLPFVTEAVYERIATLRNEGDCPDIAGVELPLSASRMLCTSPWPIVSASLIDDEAEREFEQLRSLVEEIRQVRAQHGVVPKRRITLHCSSAQCAQILQGGGIVETTAGLEAVTADAPDGAAVTISFCSCDCHLSGLADAVDVDAQRERITREIEGYEKQIANMKSRLSNASYVDKAPAKLVDQTRSQLASAEAELEQARARLAELDS
jgi:valyl-tRNA synthetase